MRALILVAALWLVLCVASGCTGPAPIPPASTPATSPTPAPSPTLTPVLRRITAPPRDLVLQREDLPGGFSLGGQQSELPDEWSVLYLRPDAVRSQYSSFANLVSAIASVRVLADDFQALKAYREQEKLIPTELASALGQATGKPEDVIVEKVALAVPAVDQATGFRLGYRVGTVRLSEYRFLLLSGNSIARLMLTALAETNGAEPARLREQADAIATKQAERLMAARQHPK